MSAPGSDYAFYDASPSLGNDEAPTHSSINGVPGMSSVSDLSSAPGFGSTPAAAASTSAVPGGLYEDPGYNVVYEGGAEYEEATVPDDTHPRALQPTPPATTLQDDTSIMDSSAEAPEAQFQFNPQVRPPVLMLHFHIWAGMSTFIWCCVDLVSRPW